MVNVAKKYRKDSPLNCIDLTHIIREGMPGYPGTPGPEILAESDFATDGYRETRLRLSSHTGTHMDAPSHMITDGCNLDRIPVSQFSGNALVADLTHCSTIIRREYIERAIKDAEPFDILLLHTGWDRYWGHPLYYSGFPVPDEAAVDLILSLPIKILGMDIPSCDPVDATHYANHIKLLGNNTLLIENLTNLNLLPHGRPISFSAFPLHYANADGSPVRAIAWL